MVTKPRKKTKNERKEKTKVHTSSVEVEEAPARLVTHVNNILSSIFSSVKVYINSQQIYKSDGLYAHQSYNYNNFKGATFELNGGLHCEGYDYEEFPDEIMKAPLSELFFNKENENAR